jgi:hypothetical protein
MPSFQGILYQDVCEQDVGFQQPDQQPCKDTLVKLSYGTATRRDVVVRPSFKSKLDAVMTCAGTAKFKLSINSSGRCNATEAKSPHMVGNGIDFKLGRVDVDSLRCC